jgi:adenine-specific DNA-methyltransferase
MLFLRDYLTEPLSDIWTDISTINLARETCELGVFRNGQKPLALIKRLISLHPKRDAVVLDFFAGSGTTGHAVLDLNAADGGARRFVLCTNAENGTFESMTLPRLTRALRGYVDAKGQKIDGRAGGLDVYEAIE